MNRLRLIVMVLLSATLAGCLLLPGKFDSALDLRRDGTFHFHYAGELVFLPLTDAMRSQMASGMSKMQSGQAAAPTGDQAEVFTEETCSRPDTGEARACSPDEIAAQHRAWDARSKPAAPRDPGAGAMMAMLGGMNASDPNAGATMADALRRQAGWHKVVYRGNGVFDVDFDAGGRLDHDFTFPTLEHGVMIMPLISVLRRADGTVRVEAPGFAPGMGNMSALSALGGSAAAANNPLKGLPATDGVFVVSTDGTILANNTEDGPAANAGAQRLTWHVAAGRAAAPTALIRPN